MQSHLFAENLSAGKTTAKKCEMVSKNAKFCAVFGLQNVKGNIEKSDVR